MCSCCESASVAPDYRFFTPSCEYCAARLIKRLGAMAIPRDEITARRKAVLADWLKYDHSEKQIRDLVKNGPWTAPKIEKAKK